MDSHELLLVRHMAEGRALSQRPTNAGGRYGITINGYLDLHKRRTHGPRSKGCAR